MNHICQGRNVVGAVLYIELCASAHSVFRQNVAKYNILVDNATMMVVYYI